MYFDVKNGSLIEVFAPACSATCDTTGKNITKINIASRDGNGITTINTTLDTNSNVQPYDSIQSINMVIQSQYRSYYYTTSCNTTNIYQLIYISWNNDTYLYIIDLSANTTAGTNIRTIYANPTGIVTSQTSTSTLQPYTSLSSEFVSNSGSSLSANLVSGYGSPLLILGSDSLSNSVYYDVANGNIVLNIGGGGGLRVYNRRGATVSNLTTPTTTWDPSQILKSSIINDITGISIVLIAYNNDTVISILKTDGDRYIPNRVYRFNKTSIVLSNANDTDRISVNITPGPTSGSTPGPTTAPTTTATTAAAGNSNVCGDELSCKWYWYFNTIAQRNGNGETYFSDDYFLKTEAVPPVCPQCPNCPSGCGVCTNCGGSGGSGTSITTTTEETITSSSTLPAGAIRDNSGNVFIPVRDSSGNIRYQPYSSTNASGNIRSSTTKTTETKYFNIPPGANAPRGAVAIKMDLGNFTFVDREGNFLSTADPNTFGGVVSLTALNAGSIANNLVSTTADLAKGAGSGTADFIKDSASGIGGFAKDAASGAVDLAKDTVGGAVGLAKDTVGGAVGLLKDVGSGIVGLGDRQQGDITVNNNNVSTGSSSLGYTPFGSNRTMGIVPGQTPIDNYSYYGALQSKGGNYMPVTADFSAFRK
jgi:hypothetical protein